MSNEKCLPGLSRAGREGAGAILYRALATMLKHVVIVFEAMGSYW